MAAVVHNETTDENEEADSAANGHTNRLTVLESHGYVLERTLGSGSYSTVKLARSERHQDFVAIKIVSRFQAPVDYLTRFLPREVEIIKELRHPNVIRFLQAVDTTHRAYIIMEYAENGTILDIIKKDAFIEEEPRAKKWFSQLRDALEYCHNHGVVHRDVKCENLLMSKEFDLKLSDFGFARGHMSSRSGGSPVMSETFCGSYAYASPEILRGIPYEPQLSDVWSMGVVLYAMLFGQLPFDDSNFNNLVRAVQSRLHFPREPKVSDLAKQLLKKLISPLKTRLRVSKVAREPWLRPPSSSPKPPAPAS